jgi:hypothetical protein
LGHSEGPPFSGCVDYGIQTRLDALVCRFFEEETMKKRRSTKLIHEGRYVAEVDIDLLDSKEGWSPYLSLEDALKLDDVRAALRRGDLESATRLSRVFTLTPVAV